MKRGIEKQQSLFLYASFYIICKHYSIYFHILLDFFKCQKFLKFESRKRNEREKEELEKMESEYLINIEKELQRRETNVKQRMKEVLDMVIFSSYYGLFVGSLISFFFSWFLSLSVMFSIFLQIF